MDLRQIVIMVEICLNVQRGADKSLAQPTS